MQSKREAKREELRNRLIQAAEDQITQEGLRGLKARDITARAGCALGALYNVVHDLDELVTLVNSRTLGALGAALSDSVPDTSDPAEKMQALARAYVDFALTNKNRWSAIFSHRLPEGRDVPDWHKEEYAGLISEIIAPLAQMRPDLPADILRLRAQTLFASVHGVVQLALHGQFVGAPLDLLASEVAALVEAMTRGIHLVTPKVR